MLKITIPSYELYDESIEEFVTTKEQDLVLEHSLVSLSKWESKWCKPFLSDKPKTREEELDYVRCMTITQNVDPIVYKYIPQKLLQEINDYIEAPMTATFFTEQKNKKANKEIITNELIYYWMITLGIPVEFEKWHLNRLITLIRVCSAKNSPQKKMSKKETTEYYKNLNEIRRKQLNSKG